MLFEWGVDAKTVQEMMGHASIKMTMDLYSHVLPNTQADAIRRLEALFSPSTAVRLPSEGGLLVRDFSCKSPLFVPLDSLPESWCPRFESGSRHS
jgi:hypothetical protein